MNSCTYLWRSDSYGRVHLEVRESDSPFLLKRSRSSQRLPQETDHMKPSVAKSKLEPKTLFTPSDDCHESELASTFNWKDFKKEQLISQQQSLYDKKLAIETRTYTKHGPGSMDHPMDLVHEPPRGPGPWTTPWNPPLIFNRKSSLLI